MGQGFDNPYSMCNFKLIAFHPENLVSKKVPEKAPDRAGISERYKILAPIEKRMK